MENENTMKCPFRQDEDGEFKPCYKEKCMAYFDMKQYSLHPESAEPYPCCRKLEANGRGFYYGGCV